MLTQRCLVQGRKSTTLNNWNHFPPFYYSFFDFEQCFSTIAQSAYVTYFPYCHWSLLLDQTLLWLGREGIKKREEGKRCVCGRGGGGGERLWRWLIEGRLLFEEIRYLRTLSFLFSSFCLVLFVYPFQTARRSENIFFRCLISNIHSFERE